MRILRPVLRFIGQTEVATPRAKPATRPHADIPEPILLSPSQREQSNGRISEFIADTSSVHAHAFAAIARANVLPLYFDWTAFMALSLWSSRVGSLR